LTRAIPPWPWAPTRRWRLPTPPYSPSPTKWRAPSPTRIWACPP